MNGGSQNHPEGTLYQRWDRPGGEEMERGTWLYKVVGCLSTVGASLLGYLVVETGRDIRVPVIPILGIIATFWLLSMSVLYFVGKRYG